MNLVFQASSFAAKFSPSVANILLRKTSGAPYLAHHGLQRSGTNYLCQCLMQLNIYPLNAFDEVRSSPRHKHCRWYAEKESIPSFLLGQYGNSFNVDNISQLNSVCGYPPATSHLVVFKDKRDWLVSVLNWGMRCGWFAERESALESIPSLVRDYGCYLSFWSKLSINHSGSVALISPEEMFDNPFAFKARLESFGFKVGHLRFNGNLALVPQSPPGRKSYFVSSDLSEYFDGNKFVL